MATYTQKLAQVETQIAKAEAAAEAAHGDRRVKRDLAALYSERRRLEPLAAREAAGRSGPSISRGAGW